MDLAIHSTAFSSIPIRELPTKTFSGKFTTFSSVCEPLPPDRPLWFPGSSPPEWLDDFGFDTPGLGSDPELLKWFAQAELIHSRWAMLAVAGIQIPEWLESLGLIDNFSWYGAGEREYFADSTTLFVVQLVLMGWVEGRRWADIINQVVLTLNQQYLTRRNQNQITKEIKNGRLAMLAFVGFCFQAVYTGQGPIENLVSHIADPGYNNIFSAFASQ
ncbi:unnamed protein product [Withania somnifera]